MQKVTYLLGAGASAQCLPVVNEMAKGIFDTSGLLYKYFMKRVALSTRDENIQAAMQSEVDVHNRKVAYINIELDWLRKICDTHYSIDTYAKKIYLKGDEEKYIKLKNILSLYFTIQQVMVPPDKRYDNFWASILDSKDNFPKQLRVISWNYDSQLELSYKNFVSSLTLDEAYRRIGMASFYDHPRQIETENFGVFKLNGSAKFVKKQQGKNYSNYLIDDFNFENTNDGEYNEAFFNKLHDAYKFIQSDPMKNKEESHENEISFAWEHRNNINQDYYDKLKASIIDTKILVVIGYSFPFFNRRIDKMIINDYMPNLEKVYFQAPDAENLKERFLPINSNRNNRIHEENMFLRKDENQFTFPNELDI